MKFLLTSIGMERFGDSATIKRNPGQGRFVFAKLHTTETFSTTPTTSRWFQKRSQWLRTKALSLSDRHQGEMDMNNNRSAYEAEGQNDFLWRPPRSILLPCENAKTVNFFLQQCAQRHGVAQ